MIRLVFLLLGAQALKPMWWILATAGAIWILLGIGILYDLGDGRLSVVLDTLAIFLIIEGVVEIAAACARGAREHWIDILRGVAFLFAAFVVFDVPWDNNIAASILFGLAFLVDGLFRMASAFVVHSKRWRVGITAGLIEVGLAVVILASKPLPHRLTVPFASLFSSLHQVMHCCAWPFSYARCPTEPLLPLYRSTPLVTGKAAILDLS